MIALFTDFGLEGPYVGQMKAVLSQGAPGVPVVDLMHDAPAFDPRASAYLLAALASEFPKGCVFLCVVDPGVGGRRKPVALHAAGRWFVGPGNGLMQIAARQDPEARWHEITWKPPRLSSSFHGRDLFAPVAAAVASGEDPGRYLAPCSGAAGADWPDDLREVIYVDRYGNALTGVRAALSSQDLIVKVNGRSLAHADTFSDCAKGEPFWYVNSIGLVEIAVNQGRADEALGLRVGTPVALK